jgi:hypothetical protein
LSYAGGASFWRLRLFVEDFLWSMTESTELDSVKVSVSSQFFLILIETLNISFGITLFCYELFLLYFFLPDLYLVILKLGAMLKV